MDFQLAMVFWNECFFLIFRKTLQTDLDQKQEQGIVYEQIYCFFSINVVSHFLIINGSKVNSIGKNKHREHISPASSFSI